MPLQYHPCTLENRITLRFSLIRSFFAAPVSEKKEYLTMADIMRLFAKYPYKHIQYRLNENSNHHGIATFSKYPIINKQYIDYPSTFNLSIYSDILIKGKGIINYEVWVGAVGEAFATEFMAYYKICQSIATLPAVLSLAQAG